MHRRILSVCLLLGLAWFLPAQAQSPEPFPPNTSNAKVAVQDGLTAIGSSFYDALENRGVLQRLAAELGKRYSNAPSLEEIKRLLILLDSGAQWDLLDPDRAPLKLMGNVKVAFARQEPRGINPDMRSVTEQTWPGTLTNGEKVAMQTYSGASAGAMNPDLHAKGWVAPRYALVHDRLQSAFRKAQPFNPPIDVARGVRLAGPQLDNFLNALRTAQKDGKPYTMPGYASTTYGTKVLPGFDGNINLHIKARHGLDLYPISLYPEEKEVLLNHNARYHVKSITQDGAKTKWIIHLEQIPPGADEKK